MSDHRTVKGRLHTELATWANAGRHTPGDYHYPSWAAFLQREAEPFDCVPCTRSLYMRPRFCYGNAIMLAAMVGLPYVEGMACPRIDMPAVPHAWNLNAAGQAIDSTWALGEAQGAPVEGRAYFGVRFAVKRADKATWDGDANVLDDWKHKWPILREPWPGEDSPGDREGLVERMVARDDTVTVQMLETAWARRRAMLGEAA